MLLLLDTHIVLWAVSASGKLSQRARDLITNEENTLLFSAASIWEVAIKASQGRAGFQVDPGVLRRGLIDNGYEELVIKSTHAAAVSGLPRIHKDPFDRILIAQARVEGILLLTADHTVARYGPPTELVL